MTHLPQSQEYMAPEEEYGDVCNNDRFAQVLTWGGSILSLLSVGFAEKTPDTPLANIISGAGVMAGGCIAAAGLYRQRSYILSAVRDLTQSRTHDSR